MDVDLIFYEAFPTCPWFNSHNDTCTGQVTYNGHVNDARYGKCDIHTCPIWHFIYAYATLKEAS